MKSRLLLFPAVTLALAFFAAPLHAEDAKEVKDIRVIIKTDQGDIEATIFASKAPLTSASFLNLAKHKFFDGLTFHRVEPGFVIQGGDPRGNGTGGPGYEFENEIVPGLKHSKAGILSMANAGPDTNGSQFFITHRAVPQLDGGYSVFGEVSKGQDVVNKIQVGDKIKSVEILDSTDALFAAKANRIAEWNKALKK